jgi:hypothetical protein
VSALRPSQNPAAIRCRPEAGFAIDLVERPDRRGLEAGGRDLPSAPRSFGANGRTLP